MRNACYRPGSNIESARADATERTADSPRAESCASAAYTQTADAAGTDGTPSDTEIRADTNAWASHPGARPSAPRAEAAGAVTSMACRGGRKAASLATAISAA
jgi:hypothetical protein